MTARIDGHHDEPTSHLFSARSPATGRAREHRLRVEWSPRREPLIQTPYADEGWEVLPAHKQLRQRMALLHESNVARNDPDPVVGHRLIAYDAGLPKSLIRFSTLHARTASAPCPAELRARKPSPMLDVYRKKTFSTRACRW